MRNCPGKNQAIVNGNIIVAGGTITVNGEIRGDIVAFGGVINVSETGHVTGKVNTVGGVLQQADKSRIDGGVSKGVPQDFNWNFNPSTSPVVPAAPRQNSVLTQIMWAGLQALALAAMAVLCALLFPVPTRRVADAIAHEPVISGGIGLLTLIVTPALLLVLTLTIILIPLTLIGALLAVLAGLFGWIALGFELGERLAKLFNTQWAAPVSAGVGTLVLSLVVSSINIIPCVGWVVGFLLVVLALGGIVLTRFGTQPYVSTRQSIPPAPLAPAAPMIMSAPIVPPTPPQTPGPSNGSDQPQS